MKNLPLYLFLASLQMVCSLICLAGEPTLFADLKMLGIENQVKEGFRFTIIGQNLIYANSTTDSSGTKCAISKFNLVTKKLVTKNVAPFCGLKGVIGIGKDLMVVEDLKGEFYLLNIEEFFNSGSVIGQQTEYFYKSSIFTNPEGTRTYFVWGGKVHFFDHISKELLNTGMGIYWGRMNYQFLNDKKHLIVITNDDCFRGCNSRLYIYDLHSNTYSKGENDGFDFRIYYELNDVCTSISGTEISVRVYKYIYPVGMGGVQSKWGSVYLDGGNFWFLGGDGYPTSNGFKCEYTPKNGRVYYRPEDNELMYEGVTYPMPFPLLAKPLYSETVFFIKNNAYFFAQAKQHLLLIEEKTGKIVKDIFRESEANEFVLDESQSHLFILQKDGLYQTSL